jgi:nitrite reductase/ring-hydroxylating ferredoxin subunit
MQKYLFFLFSILFLTSCDKGSFNNNNPYIPNYDFRVEIDTNLPSYNQLQFPGSAIKYYSAAVGASGLIIFNTGSGFLAYDGACPNQALSSCSTLTLNGINAICPCDDASYSLYTGQATGKEYPLKPYRVEVVGTLVRVFD